MRRWPSTLGGAVYLGVVAATAVGLAVVGFGPWRRGVVVIGIATLVAAATRLVLSNDDGGMLRVRTKPFDVVLLVGAGVLLIVLASVIPAHST
ncbi:MAG TPA: DUF3017 domain-containing protein [Marmoricola sp.]